MHRYTLGVDTGGTYTDAVALSTSDGRVIASAKALTTRADLAVGIAQAIAGLESIPRHAIALVCLSSTLATNAIVEGHGGRVSLFLIGYDPELIERFGFQRDLVVDDVVHIRGGHDIYGRQARPLDEDAVRRAAAERVGQVDAVAISDYLGVRNPAHELRARDLVRQVAGCPVTCGHELSEELDSIRRATTVALNARLIPLLGDLVGAVRRALAAQDIRAPLMIVRGDGSLVSSAFALEHPVETILSGPAASVVGARYLTGRDDLVVVDMGGTTTDLAILRGGRPRANPRGAWVAGWRTLVRAVDTRSVGLGGDSHVWFSPQGELRVGPERVVPLSLAATEAAGLPVELSRLTASTWRRPIDPQFFCLSGRPPPPGLTSTERELLQLLRTGPRSLAEVARGVPWAQVYLSYPNRLVAGGYIQRIGFTPTDALHVLGTYTPWSREAALEGARVLARGLDTDPETLAAEVVGLVADRLAGEIVAQVAADETGEEGLLAGQGSEFFLQRALHPERGSALGIRFRLRLALGAIGAPVAAYFPLVAEKLGAELVIPEHAGVANAVGAASGSVVQRVEVLVEPEDDLTGIVGYRAHTPGERREFKELAAALAYARQAGREHALEAARRAGAEDVVVEEERSDQSGSVAVGLGGSLYLGSRLSFTAIGRPRLAPAPPGG